MQFNQILYQSQSKAQAQAPLITVGRSLSLYEKLEGMGNQFLRHADAAFT
jgi:hypothetical protein